MFNSHWAITYRERVFTAIQRNINRPRPKSPKEYCDQFRKCFDTLKNGIFRKNSLTREIESFSVDEYLCKMLLKSSDQNSEDFSYGLQLFRKQITSINSFIKSPATLREIIEIILSHPFLNPKNLPKELAGKGKEKEPIRIPNWMTHRPES